MLGSGAGIVALGLVQTTRDRDRAQRELRDELARGTRASARLLAEALAQGPFEEFPPPAATVRVERGSVVVAPPFEAESRPADPEAQARSAAAVEDALRLEFGRGEPAAARALLERAVFATEHKGPLVSALAWLEQRAGDAAARDRWLDHAACPESLSRILLLARAGRDVGTLPRSLLARADPELALGVLDQVRACAPQAIDERRYEEYARFLALASAHQHLVRSRDRLAEHGGPFVERCGDALVLGTLAAGTGTLRIDLGQPLLEAIAKRSRSPFTGTPLLAHRAPPDAIVAIPDVAAVALPSTPATGAPTPDRTFWLLLVLAGTFVLGGAASFQALRRESRAMAARAEFLTSVTHELKTPIAGIRLLAEMLEEGRVQDEAKRLEYHHRIAGETMRLSTLIENVLDLGRMERGERGYDLRTVDVREVVQEVHELFAVVATREGLRTAARLDERPAFAHVDRGAVAQALWNLLDNARKYARDGGLVEVHQRGGTIRVRDHGPGIAAPDRERIFAKFVRGAGQADGSVPGLGLGLHLARAIATALGGTLVCRDPADGAPGVEFVLTLPEHTPPP